MIHIFHGEDEFSRAEALAALLGTLGPPESLAPNSSRFEADRTTPGEVIAASVALPFLSEHRLVVLEGALSAAEGSPRGRRPERSGWLALAEAATRLPPTTTLVLLDGKVRRDNPLLKALAPLAQVREFTPLRRQEVERWAQDRAARRGVRLEAPAARLLADLVGGDLRALSHEIDKLATYVGTGVITAQDVEALTVEAREASVFALVDALVEGRRRVALELLYRSLADGAAPQYILVMVARQLRLLVQAKELLESGSEPPEIGRALGMAPGFALQKTLEQARRGSFARFEGLQKLTLEADIATKTGRLRDDLALSVLFAGEPGSPQASQS